MPVEQSEWDHIKEWGSREGVQYRKLHSPRVLLDDPSLTGHGYPPHPIMLSIEPLLSKHIFKKLVFLTCPNPQKPNCELGAISDLKSLGFRVPRNLPKEGINTLINLPGAN
ncbi:hypothetical protein J6590_069366 [Homalodisca vitripennis]|nr:hypothetical protein J6590_090558 [Homalodisca vitripennis]KAG8305472.1 hypothetical protein J6590_069366 [Homalodisca vitripennis]